MGRVPLFGAGPRRYIRSRLFRLACHRFLACPYRFLAAKGQAKAGLSSRHSHYRTAFESFAPDISKQPDPNLTDLFDTRNHGSQSLSASYLHTRHVVVTRTHARTYNARQRDKALTVPRRPPVRPNTAAASSQSVGWSSFTLHAASSFCRGLRFLGES